jgi:hypothetical protein
VDLHSKVTSLLYSTCSESFPGSIFSNFTRLVCHTGLRQRSFLFPSAYFWLCLPITILFSLLPRYLAKAWKFGYMPDDIDIVRWNRKMDPNRDLGHDAYFAAPLAAMRRSNSIRRSADIHHSTARASSRPVSIASRADSVTTLDLRRPGMEQRSGSRTDMSTGQALGPPWVRFCDGRRWGRHASNAE